MSGCREVVAPRDMMGNQSLDLLALLLTGQEGPFHPIVFHLLSSTATAVVSMWWQVRFESFAD